MRTGIMVKCSNTAHEIHCYKYLSSFIVFSHQKFLLSGLFLGKNRNGFEMSQEVSGPSATWARHAVRFYDNIIDVDSKNNRILSYIIKSRDL